MKIDLTKQEYKWLADLANKAKIEADQNNTATPHPLWELRHDNMASLEAKINAGIKLQIKREDRGAR